MFVGRSDAQVKLRGFRIEPGEVEAVLVAHPGVAQAVVVVRDDGGGGAVGGVCGGGRRGWDEGAGLRRFVAGRLPEFMVPAVVVRLERVPVTVNGKVDRRGLPAPDYRGGGKRVPGGVDAGGAGLAGLFAQVLGVARVGVDDDFFGLGGHSLLATRLVARIRTELGVEVPIRVVFDAPTVAGLAGWLAGAGPGRVRVGLTARPRPAWVPVSYAQRRMWFLNRFEPGSAAYNIPVGLRLRGRLDIAALACGVRAMWWRGTRALRTVFPRFGAGCRLQRGGAGGGGGCGSTPVRVVGAGELAAAVVGGGVGGGSTWSRGCRCGRGCSGCRRDEHVLVVVVHHIAADGASMAPLARDLAVAYAARVGGREPGWVPLPVQYADYTLWQREVLGDGQDPGSVLARAVRVLACGLAGAAGGVGVADGSAAAGGAVVARGRCGVRGGRGGACGGGRRVGAGASGATCVHDGACGVGGAVARLWGGADMAIGDAGGRSRGGGVDDLVGFFVNTVVLRVGCAGDPAVRAGARSRCGRAIWRRSRIRRCRSSGWWSVLAPARSTAHHPLFQVSLAMVDTIRALPRWIPGAGGGAGADLDPGMAKFDLQLSVAERLRPRGGAGRGWRRGSIRRATCSTRRRCAGSWIGSCGCWRRCARIPRWWWGMWGFSITAERRRLAPVRGPAGGAVGRALGEILTDAAGRDANAVALRCAGTGMSYGELDERSNRLARVLIARGAGPEGFVAVALSRSVQSVLAVWAVTKTGAAVLPVDPGYPPARITHMLTDSGAALGVTVAEHRDRLPGGVDWVVLDEPGTVAAVAAVSGAAVPDSDRRVSVRVDQPAYLIYTSGSSGVPKGVVVTHRGLDRFRGRVAGAVRGRGRGRGCWGSPRRVSTRRCWSICWRSGRRARWWWHRRGCRAGCELARLLAAERVTHAFLTPAALGTVDPEGLDGLGHVLVGGEACPPGLVTRWAPGRAMFDAYGPTEATVVANVSDPLVAGGPVTVGAPVRGVREVVLDARLRPVPVGVVGELYVAGPRCGAGVLGSGGVDGGAVRGRSVRAGGGADVSDRGSGAVARASGELEYVGRSDVQVKLRGFRIEPGEVEAALAGASGGVAGGGGGARGCGGGWVARDVLRGPAIGGVCGAGSGVVAGAGPGARGGGVGRAVAAGVRGSVFR